jgi:hypothetical protein
MTQECEKCKADSLRSLGILKVFQTEIDIAAQRLRDDGDASIVLAVMLDELILALGTDFFTDRVTNFRKAAFNGGLAR